MVSFFINWQSENPPVYVGLQPNAHVPVCWSLEHFQQLSCHKYMHLVPYGTSFRWQKKRNDASFSSQSGRWLASFVFPPPLRISIVFIWMELHFSKPHLKIQTGKCVGYTWNSHLNPSCLNLCDFCNEVNVGLGIIKSQILQGVLTLAHVPWCAGRISKL